MNNIFVWIILGLVSIVLGLFEKRSSEDKESFSRFFMDIWRISGSFFLTGILIYFFIAIRWPMIRQINNLSIVDFVLGIIILFGMLGWIPHLIKGVTEKIDKILNKIINK